MDQVYGGKEGSLNKRLKTDESALQDKVSQAWLKELVEDKMQPLLAILWDTNKDKLAAIAQAGAKNAPPPVAKLPMVLHKDLSLDEVKKRKADVEPLLDR